MTEEERSIKNALINSNLKKIIDFLHASGSTIADDMLVLEIIKSRILSSIDE